MIWGNMSNRNSWFKHYNNSHDDSKIYGLWAAGRLDLIAFYWALLELISRFESEDFRGFWSGNLQVFKAKLNLNSNRSSRYLKELFTHSLIELEWITKTSFKVSVRKWLELQENGVRKKTQKHQDIRKESKEKRYKSKITNNIFEIYSSTELADIRFRRATEIEQFTNLLKNEQVFGERFPTLIKNNIQNFAASVLKIYGFEIEDFRQDLNAIINEKFADEKTGPAKADYIATRIKNKALELYNAAK